MKIKEHIFLVGSGVIGLRISHPLDCNVYVLDGGNEAALIDAGSGVEPERIVREMESDGIDLKKLRTVLLTHPHGDHAAGARFWHDNFGMKVFCANKAAEWIEAGDEEKTSVNAARQAGIYPADFNLPPCPVERRLDEGDEITIGDITLSALDTDGHSTGHLSFWMPAQKALFSGDLIFPGGRIAPQVTWDFSIMDLMHSIEKIHELHIEALYAGHAAPLLRDAHNDVDLAYRRLKKLSFPKTLV